MTSLQSVRLLRSRVAPNLIPSSRIPKAQVFWIGCSDSGFDETRTLDLLPEEVFEHRNVANILSDDDISASSSLDYALKILEVKHIVVCGHYECSFVNVNAKYSPMRKRLKDVSAIYEQHRDDLEHIVRPGDRNRSMVELNVWSQVQSLLQKDGVRQAQRERGLKVHALVYNAHEREWLQLTVAE